jgi:hypothetical protein
MVHSSYTNTAAGAPPLKTHKGRRPRREDQPPPGCSGGGRTDAALISAVRQYCIQVLRVVACPMDAPLFDRGASAWFA